MASPSPMPGPRARTSPLREAESANDSAAKPTGKRHEVLGLIVLTTAVLLALALFSYDMRGGRNLAGPAGAQVAESLVVLLGTASLLLPWSLLVLSVRLFRKTERPIQLPRALGTFGIVIAVATSLHLAFIERPMLGSLPAGGLVGTALAEWLRVRIGDAGAHLIALTTLLIALILRTRLSIVSVAAGAKTAGVRSGVVARQGLLSVARAWMRAREQDKRERNEREKSEAPRVEASENKAELVVAEAIAAAGAAPLLTEADDAQTEAENIIEHLREVPMYTEEADDNGELFASALRSPAPVVVPASTPSPRTRNVRSSPRVVEVSEAPSTASVPLEIAESEALAAREEPSSAEATAPDGAVQIATEGNVARQVAVAPKRVKRLTRVRATRAANLESPAMQSEDVAPVRPVAPVVSVVHHPRVESVSLPAVEPVASVRDVPDEAPAPASVEDPEEQLDEDLEDATADALQSLQIVSHDDEIEQAKSTPVIAESRDRVVAGPMEMPSTTLLAPVSSDAMRVDEEQLRASADRLVRTLRDYGIEGHVVEVHPGPVVTTFEFVPAAGTKLSKIARLADDIAMNLEANRVRIVAPIPGKGRVGFEIPNVKRQTVYFRELLETEAFRALGGAMPVALGKDVVGAPYFADVAAMPHLIVAGATGAGKSVGLNVMLASLLFKRGPQDVRMLMIDPKVVELAVYDGIPHMLLPVVTDMKKASLALRWVVDEMERRYALFAQTGARNITTYNERVMRAVNDGVPMKGLHGAVRAKENGTTVQLSPSDAEAAGEAKPFKLPYILVVVDEFADLMMVAGKEVEAAVARLAQKARAAGIHVILATQRPSVDVITGVIKANFPSRVAFKVSQKVDSRTILDQQGAEHLLGRGDMLILPPGSGDLKRVHCAFVNEDEIQAITDHWRKQAAPTYDEEILRPRDEEGDGNASEPDIKVPQDKYEKAVALVLGARKCSVSWVQRQLAVGYNVAARMVEKMEREGIVGPPKGPGKEREVMG